MIWLGVERGKLARNGIGIAKLSNPLGNSGFSLSENKPRKDFPLILRSLWKLRGTQLFSIALGCLTGINYFNQTPSQRT